MEKQYRRHRQLMLVSCEPGCATFVEQCLEAHEFAVRHVQSSTEAAVSLQGRVPELIILVAGSAGASCDEACRRIRETSKVPLLVLCASSSDGHVARVLRYGADDHIPMTVDEDELEARVLSLLRRNQLSGYLPAEEIEAGPLTIDCRRAVCSVNGRDVKLTPKEFKLLSALALHPGQILSHNQLIERVWGSPYHASPENLRKLIQRVRESLAGLFDSKDAIAAAPGFGYYLGVGEGEHGKE